MVSGKPPALIFVVRHGARLDAADKDWHLTSPTPYDPPLTYGGWTQCRALGARIASILLAIEAAHLQEEAHSAQAENTGKSKFKRKKHRIILHSSPYLRCIQTSIGIAAGLSQFNGSQNEIRAHHRAAQSSHARKSSDLETIQDDEQEPAELKVLDNLPIKPFPRTKLRIDAFLGEWFSPEYYEHITHPPDSVLMLAGAKAELLKRGDSIEVGELQHEPPPKPVFFPGGWGSPITKPNEPEKKSQGKMPQIPDVEPLSLYNSPVRRDRATTIGNTLDPHRFTAELTKSTGGGYVPPIPRYAISPSDPIPKGYTAHAQEACIDVDYSWDSTRSPQNWGDGGEYGEEWSAMQKRLRSGIVRMVHWYQLHHESALQSHGHMRALHPAHEEETDEDCEVDTVLVLVTHSAGCNALIGALTDQPVLREVAMASLTMAMRRDLVPAGDDTSETLKSSKSSTSLSRQSTNDGLSLPKEYNVLITASIDHLRRGSNPLSIPILQNPALAFRNLFVERQARKQTTLPYIPQRRWKLSNATRIMASPIDQTISGAGPIYGGVQRSASAAARPDGSPSASLWGTTLQTQSSNLPITAIDISQQQVSSPANEQSGNPSSSSTIMWQSPTTSQPATPATTPGLWPARETGTLVESSPGLWSARKVSDTPSSPLTSVSPEVSSRSAAAKRRWTVNENSGM